VADPAKTPFGVCGSQIDDSTEAAPKVRVAIYGHKSAHTSFYMIKMTFLVDLRALVRNLDGLGKIIGDCHVPEAETKRAHFIHKIY
jgi:hypothetical protein